MSNPLLEITNVPQFDRIKPEHFVEAISTLVAETKKISDEVAKIENPTWENFYRPQEHISDKLSRAFAPISHLNAVMNSDEIRTAYQQILPMLSDLDTFVGQHQGLYEGFKKLKESQKYQSYTQEQKKAIENALRDFTLSGIALNSEDQKRFGEISSRLSELSSKFNNNVLDATGAFELIIENIDELKGLPQSAIDAATLSAKTKGKEGYRFTLDYPSYLPAMLYCENETIRETLYKAFSTRASDCYEVGKEWDNTEIINEILELRLEKAQLLGMKNYAELSIAPKMAQSTEQVVNFLENLTAQSKAQGNKEIQELYDFALKHYGKEKLNPWDIAFYSEKQKEALYSINDEALRAYFPEPRVVAGLFELVNRLYGVTIEKDESVATWHKDVKFYKIFDKDGKHKASFYMDLYAREHKRGGAWMAGCVTKRVDEQGNDIIPVAFLTCNFNGPVGDNPALFTHSEVTTLFHEFGHGMHHMMTEVKVAALSGIAGVPWDAVELPSQFMENWCWEADALEFISGHFETNEPLSKDMLDKMLKAKNYQAAMFVLRQLEFGLFDFRLHLAKPHKNIVMETLGQVKKDVAVVPSPDYIRTPHSFGHIFAGGYAAGYYSYLWAEVLSADAFSKFEEDGIFNRETGLSFLKNILSKGGSDEPSTLFKNFRGREASLNALLRHKGIA